MILAQKIEEIVSSSSEYETGLCAHTYNSLLQISSTNVTLRKSSKVQVVLLIFRFGSNQ